MTGGARFLRIIALILAILSLPLSLTGAASAEASVTATHAVVRASSHASTLAARRALVRRETSFAAERLKGRAVASKVAREERKLSGARLRALVARAREEAVRRAGLSPAGIRQGGLRQAVPESAAPAASIEGEPVTMWLEGPGGTIGVCSLGCFVSGTVTPGEPVTVFTSVFSSGAGGTVPVTVTWTQQCGLSATTTVGTQTVQAPDISSGVPGAIASATFTVQDTCPDPLEDFQNYEIEASATPQVSGSSTGADFMVTYWGSVDSAQLGACNCSADSATPTAAQADAGDPVDTVSGDYAETVTDAALKSPGYPLVISRSYSSADTASGALGPGWSLPWQASLAENSPSSGDVTFTAENGDQYVYVSNGSTGFNSPTGALSRLAEVTDSSGNVTGYTLTTPGNDVLTFNPSGQLVSQTDSTGRGLTFSYNSAGQVGSITDAAGQAVTLTYSGPLLTGVTLPDQFTLGYHYTNGRLTSVVTPGGSAGATTAYTYNPAGLASVQDPDGNTVTTTYDSFGRVVSQSDGAGSVTTFSYTTTSGGLPETDVTDPNGGITSYVYSGGMLQEVVDPMNGTTGYVYNGLAEPVSVTDPLGGATTMSYDGSGNLTSLTDPLGHERQWTYDSHDNVLSYQDSNGNTTNYAYNLMDEITSATAPPPGGETTYVYDASGNLVSSTDPRGNVTGANAAAYTSTYGYDSSGQLGSVKDPDGNITGYTYDTMGFPLTVTDPLGHVTSYAYDSDERVSRVTAPGGGLTKYAYDLAGNLVSRTDPDSNTWSYAYDGDNRLMKTTDPLGNAVSYRYDGDGNQVLFTDARQITTATSYDADNRPAKITYSDGTPVVSYGYDADGDVTSVSDGTGTRTLAYNADGEVTSGGGFSYGYDNNGDVTSRTYPDGTAISYGYNQDGQVSSMTLRSSQTTYSYDPAGNLVSTAEPNGVTETRGYDNAGQLTGISDATSSAVLDSYGLTLNSDQQPTQVAVTQGGAAQLTRFYGYDNAGRLTSACYSSSRTSACSAASAGTATGSAPDPAAVTGMVTSGETGKCLDDFHSGTVAGNVIDIYACNGTGAQDWTVTAGGLMQVLGNCLAASGTSPGSVVALQPCTPGNRAETWRAGSGNTLISAASGLCLDDPGGSTTNGTQADVAACTRSVQQEWGLPGGQSGWITDGVTGICADDSGGSTTPGAAVVIWTCNSNTTQQKWGVTASGQLQIHSLCAQATAAAPSLVLQSCTAAASQRWAAGPNGWIWNIGASLCLSDIDARTANGSQIAVTTCATNPQQSWRLPPQRINSGVLANGISGECADNSGGTKAVIWSCDNSGAQQWAIGNDANIRTLSNLCWTLNGGATAASTPIALTTCGGGIDQEFAQGPAINPWITSVDGAAAGLCVSDPNASTTNGTQLLITGCNNTNPQQDWPLPPTTAPWTPAGVTATAGAASAAVSWTPASTGGDALTGYTITASPGGKTATAGPYDTSATVAGLTPGTAYTFTITTTSPAGTSAASVATSAVTPGNETTYSYDAAGNMTGTQTDGLATTSTFNADEQLTSSAVGTATTTYGYDLDGNQSSAGNTTYAYNAANELTGADTAAGSFTYAYDSGGNLTSTSLYGNPIQGTVWDLNNPLPTAAEDTGPTGTTNADYAYTPDGSLAAMLTPGGTYYPVQDWLGSLTGLTNSAGTQATATQYSPYGTPSTSNLVMGAPSPSIGFAGSYTLPGSAGLADMRMRDYSPATGSFQTVDPALAASGSPYAYASGVPTAFTDPSGTIALRDDLLQGGVIVVGIGLGVLCASGGCVAIATTVGLDALLSQTAMRVIGEGLIGAITNIAGYALSPSCHTLVGYLKAGAIGLLTGAGSQWFGEVAGSTAEESNYDFNSKLGAAGWSVAGGGVFNLMNYLFAGGPSPGGIAVAISTGIVGAFTFGKG